MNTSKRDLSVEITTEEQINHDFIEAWHNAEEENAIEAEERLCFLEPKTLFRVLSQHRLDLLHTLRTLGTANIQTLSKALHRKDGNVYRDIRLLKKAGLVKQQTGTKKLFVPWDKIRAEIDLLHEKVTV